MTTLATHILFSVLPKNNTLLFNNLITGNKFDDKHEICELHTEEGQRSFVDQGAVTLDVRSIVAKVYEWVKGFPFSGELITVLMDMLQFC